MGQRQDRKPQLTPLEADDADEDKLKEMSADAGRQFRDELNLEYWMEKGVYGQSTLEIASTTGRASTEITTTELQGIFRQTQRSASTTSENTAKSGQRVHLLEGVSRGRNESDNGDRVSDIGALWGITLIVFVVFSVWLCRHLLRSSRNFADINSEDESAAQPILPWPHQQDRMEIGAVSERTVPDVV